MQLLINLISDVSASYWLAFFFQGSHVVSEVSVKWDHCLKLGWGEGGGSPMQYDYNFPPSTHIITDQLCHFIINYHHRAETTTVAY